ncbi:DUF1996 domain-containing protein [Streptomyces sp. NPDC097610]|uniref:DUF1996 domain-containing protein n=1 Tax=Streptomyces sp. NPDC097610 TaxID=3157227 RepID=UPI003324772F
MRRNTRRRPMGAQRATFAAAALILGGGGLVAVNVYASATESGSAGEPGQANPSNQTWASGAATIDCPDVGSKLAEVPQQARAEVDKELALLDQQVSEAYARMTSEQQAKAQDTDFLQNAILGPLKEKRGAVIDRIKTDFKNAGAEAPNSLDALATCTAVPADQTQNNAGGQNGNGQQQNNNGGQQGGQQGGGQQGGGASPVSGPVAADFVDITTLQPNVPQKPGGSGNASTGTFTSSCGVNANKKFNTDNVIVAPGVTNGAHHLHDYVGNQSNDAFATNDDLAKAATTCQNQGDKSTYYWPVLRVQDGTQEFDADKNGGGLEGNVGKVLQAKQAQIEFIGNPQSKVVEMPTFLRIITGDAKAFTNGPANANAHWSCTGFENKVQLTDKYPICPQGSSVVRSFAFQSCWDGQNIDSANHRTHVAFADANGNCAGGFKAIPQLTMRLLYDAPAPTLENGQVKNPYAVDGFPEQVHKAITDHDDFINVFDASLMREMVDCINAGRQCGDGAGGGTGGGAGDNGGGNGGGGGAGTGEPSQGEPSPSPDASSGGNDATASATPTDTQTTQPPASTPGTTEPTRGGQTTGTGTGHTVVVPKADTSPSAAASDTAAAHEHHGSEATHRAQTPAAGADAPSTQATAQETSQAGSQSQSQTEPQAVTGDLADTGTNLWPAAAGGVLVIAGLVLLRRIRRSSV